MLCVDLISKERICMWVPHIQRGLSSSPSGIQEFAVCPRGHASWVQTQINETWEYSEIFILKVPRHPYENPNEISKAIEWNIYWKRPGIHMKFPMKYPRQWMKYLLNVPRHPYEIPNEISKAIEWNIYWKRLGIHMKGAMKYPMLTMKYPMKAQWNITIQY